jgi:UDP-glucose 4-epimerase
MDILITGNSGYIGSHLVKSLENSNHRIFGLDLQEPKIDVYNHMMFDIRELKGYLEYDVVIHLAALVNVGESENDPLNYYTTNLMGTLNLLNHVKTKHFIFASTGAAAEPSSAYGLSKKAAEQCVKQYCEMTNIDYTIFRFYNVIGSSCVGPTNHDGLFYNLINSIKTNEFKLFGKDYPTLDGTCVRDYVHVDEIAESIKSAISNPANNIENLGHGVGYTVLQIVNKFKEINDVEFDVTVMPKRQGDLEKSVLDNPSKYMANMFELSDLLRIDKTKFT